ncbi:MAG TPA: prepilin-type N-terminal cleavage/methylation domain-containing protein [Phycisphaerae bacterium]|nr:prepilin-type N-terminal cleavage/methylation domain-containing protein [Phycisphaerae bacterium]
MFQRKGTRRGFSLVELVIVIVIIGVIAAIAVPRISRGAKGAKDAALRADVTLLRNAVDLYAAEHGGDFPAITNDLELLTGYSTVGGVYSATKDTTHIYGPYLKAIPPLPVAGGGTTGGKIGDVKVGAIDAAGVGWLYTVATGDIEANTGTAKDEADTLYSDY